MVGRALMGLGSGFILTAAPKIIEETVPSKVFN
jgi:hypothetical protein